MAYNPFFWLDSPTSLESIAALKVAIREVATTVNTQQEAINKINKYIDELGDTVKEEVKALINEMYENGELDEIIKSVIKTQNKYPKMDYVDFARLWRAIDISNTDAYVGTYDMEYYSYTQGATHFYYNGAEYVAYCKICNNYSHFKTNNKAVITIKSARTGTTIVTTNPLTLGHANGLTELNGYLYIVHCYYYSGDNTVNNTNISRISLSSLIGGDVNPTVETKTINCDVNPYSGGFSSICAYDNELFVNAGYSLYSLNWSTGTATRILSQYLNNRPFLDEAYMQDLAITDDYIFYLVYRPSVIVRYNKNDNVVDWVYNIPDMLNDEMFLRGEPEGLTFYNNSECILVTSQHLQFAAYNQLDMTQCFYGNIENNGCKALVNHGSSRQGYETERVIIHLDNSNTNTNPNGTEANPFQNIVECLWYAQNIRQYDTVIIRLHTNSPWFSYINTNKNIEILNVGDTRHYIGSIGVEGCGQLRLNNIGLFLTLPHDWAEANGDRNDYVNHFISMKRCTFYFSNLVFEDISSQGGTIYGMYGISVTGTFSYSEGQGTTESGFNDASHTFTHFTNSTVNGHGLLSTGTNIIA